MIDPTDIKVPGRAHAAGRRHRRRRRRADARDPAARRSAMPSRVFEARGREASRRRRLPDAGAQRHQRAARARPRRTDLGARHPDRRLRDHERLAAAPRPYRRARRDARGGRPQRHAEALRPAARAARRSRSARRGSLLRPCARRSGAHGRRRRAALRQRRNGPCRAWVAGCDGVWSRTRRLPSRTRRSPSTRASAEPAASSTCHRCRRPAASCAWCSATRRSSAISRRATGRCSGSIPSRSTRRPRWRSPTRWRLAALTAELHATDPEPVRAIIAAAVSECRAAIRCSTCSICRAGTTTLSCFWATPRMPSRRMPDRAPSMAIEDAVVLAACVSARASPAQAFAAYQACAGAGRAHRQDEPPHRLAETRDRPLALFLRDLILPWVIPLGVRARGRCSATAPISIRSSGRAYNAGRARRSMTTRRGSDGRRGAAPMR